jgi:hypothetical protein
MGIENYLPHIIQGICTIIMFAFILGKYKAAFDQHEKILNRHEIAIEGILNRLDIMNNDIHYLKGFMAGKKHD